MEKITQLGFLLLAFVSPGWATTYYLAPQSAGGNDSNNGTSASTPWRTPNHALNCGDVILGEAGTYSETAFYSSNWGTVTCPPGNNVAWLKCATFDTCKVNAVLGTAMAIASSYWGVQGWEVTSNSGACLLVYPPTTSTSLHHIVLANNVATGCFYNGIGTTNHGAASADYIAFVGNIIYNAAQGSKFCPTGITFYNPLALDNLPGTHLYIGGNFSFDNVDPIPCGLGPATDGQGILLDHFDGTDGGLGIPYTMQAVVDNNITIFNGAAGVMAGSNRAGTVHAPIFIRRNTTYGNAKGSTTNAPLCGEIIVSLSDNTHVYFNLAVTNAATGCTGSNLYAYQINQTDSETSIYNNYGYSASGNNKWDNSGGGLTPFAPSNVFGSNPGYANPVDPEAPNCAGSASVPACMAGVISNFKPTNPMAAAYGYQVPSTAQTYDPLFPQWLCNVNLPPGLVTMACLPLSALPASPTITGVTVQ
jgi:hypothetical protein